MMDPSEHIPPLPDIQEPKEVADWYNHVFGTQFTQSAISAYWQPFNHVLMMKAIEQVVPQSVGTELETKPEPESYMLITPKRAKVMLFCSMGSNYDPRYFELFCEPYSSPEGPRMEERITDPRSPFVNARIGATVLWNLLREYEKQVNNVGGDEVMGALDL